MSRAQRRSVARHGQPAPTPRIDGSVALRGGPMDGWVVTPDAPALRPDWYRTLPLRRNSLLAVMAGGPTLAAGPAGRYVVEPGVSPPGATWRPLELGEG